MMQIINSLKLLSNLIDALPLPVHHCSTRNAAYLCVFILDYAEDLNDSAA
jgi:hypothetical protein